MSYRILSYFRIIAVAVAVWTAAASAAAQGTPAANHEKLFRDMYNRAYRLVGNPECLAVADSLRRMAVAVGDHATEVKALTIPMRHECSIENNSEGMERTVKALMDAALKYNEMELFYSAVSHKVTYFTNHGKYVSAIGYQKEMLEYAKRHGHNYGIVLGHVALGNIHRRRMEITKAIAEYEMALEGYKRYGLKHELGIDYKRIVECNIISCNFPKALENVDKGLSETQNDVYYSGLLGYKAFVLFMQNRDEDFINTYNQYKSYTDVRPDIHVFFANSVEVMKLIYDGNFKAVDKQFAVKGLGPMGAFKQFVQLAYYNRRKKYKEAFEVMRKLNASLYGNSTGSFTAEAASISAQIGNNLAELDKQREAGKNMQLELTNTKLDLRNNELELVGIRDAKHLAMATAEAKRLSYNNQRLLSRQLSDSLANQMLQRRAQEQKHSTVRMRFNTMLGAVATVLLLACIYLWRNGVMTRRLKRTNTDLRQTLDDLSVANDRAHESDRQKTVFIQNMSHEIRTPLNAIVGFSQLLTESGDALGDDERKDMNKIINQNSDALNTLVNDILDLTSIESGKYVIKLESVCVNKLCHKALDDTRHRMADGVRLRLKTDLPDSFAITTDGYRAGQVIVNMLTNAMKNTEVGNITLECSLGEHPGMITFSVADTGCGVPADMREKIFERFCKIDQFKQGTGLGLFVCRIIAAKLGGAIDIDPDYVGGARFWFALPL